MEEVRRRNDVRLIHAKGHSVHAYPGNDIADELARWGKEGPPFCRLRPGGGEGASRHGPVANYEARTKRRAEEKLLKRERQKASWIDARGNSSQLLKSFSDIISSDGRHGAA